MLSANAKKWVKALRSGKYRQAVGALHTKKGFCCLGVACKIAIRSGVKIKPVTDYEGDVSYDGKRAMLPKLVIRWLGLSDGFGCYKNGDLASDNDSGKTFLEIADIIESEPRYLFVEN